MPVKLTNHLLYYREKRGFSQEELAEKTGVNKVTISNIETNKTKRPHPRTRHKLADHLGVGVQQLFPAQRYK